MDHKTILKQGWLQQQHGRPQNRGESAPPTKVTLKHVFGRVSLGRRQTVRQASGRRPGPQLELWLRCRRRMQEEEEERRRGGGEEARERNRTFTRGEEKTLKILREVPGGWQPLRKQGLVSCEFRGGEFLESHI